MADDKETKKEELKDLDSKDDPKGGNRTRFTPAFGTAPGPRRRGPDRVNEPE